MLLMLLTLFVHCCGWGRFHFPATRKNRRETYPCRRRSGRDISPAAAVTLAPSAPAGTGAAQRQPGGWIRILRSGESNRNDKEWYAAPKWRFPLPISARNVTGLSVGGTLCPMRNSCHFRT